MDVNIKTVEPVDPPKIVTITLTEDEASILRAVAGAVCGPGPIRDFTDELYYALDDNGPIVSKATRFYDNNITNGIQVKH